MRLAIRLFVVVAATTAASAQDRPTEDWRGYWTQAGDTMAVTLHMKSEPGTPRYSATFDAERLRVNGIPFDTVRLEGCCNLTMSIRGDRSTLRFSGTLRGDSLFGVYRDGESDGRFSFVRTRMAGPSFQERELIFSNGSVKLSGSLILPPTGNSLPAVVFLHGSGAEGRWASRFMALQLASHGIAALIFDKSHLVPETLDIDVGRAHEGRHGPSLQVQEVPALPRERGARVGR